ncbi:MAG: T9SS type A sorting domain-containing protein [Flavobacteriales bacterium]|nr:T9SS type A sorting domain-containing protein [Flavobacteriales bacterium]
MHILINDANSMGGVAFSPSSRFLYVSSVEDVYQYDTEAPDIEASMVQIAHWDSTYSPFPPLATLFDIAQLAPDGEIYIGTGNSTDKLHVIHDPDSAGLACNIEQHGIALPRYFNNSLPNHPNYHLGPVDGSVCDSLGINAGMLEEALRLGVQAYPNPSAGNFTSAHPAQSTVGEVEVRDLSGRLLLRERIPQWSQLHSVELHEAAGMTNAASSGGHSGPQSGLY